MILLFLPLAVYWGYETVWKYRPSTLTTGTTHHGDVSERTHLRALDKAVQLHAENARLRAELAQTASAEASAKAREDYEAWNRETPRG